MSEIQLTIEGKFYVLIQETSSYIIKNYNKIAGYSTKHAGNRVEQK